MRLDSQPVLFYPYRSVPALSDAIRAKELSAVGLSEVYLGHQTWQDYISSRQLIRSFDRALEAQAANLEESFAMSGAMQVDLSQSDYQAAIESGLGGLGSRLAFAGAESQYKIEFGFAK